MPEHTFHFTPGYTTWHITWGTYGTRLHGDNRPTVDKDHNQRGQPFVAPDPPRRDTERQRMNHPPVYLTGPQQHAIQQAIPGLCERGGWLLRECAAGPDHVHVLLDIKPDIHGQKVRRLLKRWVTQMLNERWPPGSGRPGSLPTPGADGSWWAEEGSNRAIHDLAWLNNAHPYIRDQRAT